MANFKECIYESINTGMLNGMIYGSMFPAIIVVEYANELAMDWFSRFETNMVSRDRLQPTPWFLNTVVSLFYPPYWSKVIFFYFELKL